MNPVEYRLPLSDRDLVLRFAQSQTLANFIQNVTDVEFSENEAREKVHERNRLRQGPNLPRLNVEEEVIRARRAFFSGVRRDEFYPLTKLIIEEVYGPLVHNDFNGISAVAFFAHCRNIIHVMLSDRNIRFYRLRARERRSLLNDRKYDGGGDAH